MSTTYPPSEDPTLPLPRILCLHGGGVNAEVFTSQSRTLLKHLFPHFRLVFADGPFFCDPGPGIIPVYEANGPFRRWLRWLPEHAEIDAESAIEEVFYAIRTTMEGDAGTGEWVGLMGFSQGAKLAASLLYQRQVEVEREGSSEWGWRFAVCLAGRAPLVSLSKETESPGLVDAGGISEGFNFDKNDRSNILKLPTVHVHGLKDGGLHLHRILMEMYCEPGSTTLVEWDGDHRVPIKTKDVEKVVEAIMKVAKETEVL